MVGREDRECQKIQADPNQVRSVYIGQGKRYELKTNGAICDVVVLIDPKVGQVWSLESFFWTDPYAIDECAITRDATAERKKSARI